MEVKFLDECNKHYVKQFPNLRELSLDDKKVDKFISNKSNICFFVVEESKVIGLSWGYVLERMDNESMLYIHSVDVLLTHRNKGVGQLMINAYLNYQKENHLRNTFLITDEDNIPANKLYQKPEHFLETKKNLYFYK
ncbi:hypothetical protein CI105_08285 [Candidatus Izimaplasma bacterium ZiA1]|uniref:GNAT family N-acetyltransferase n=1 Tax=Candidatus Izimoplasma sp. ZiA1 TaxID=2024899 RepID=UPI000BAA736A|nr:hypothetical protein CI105_08285 [Candidatus Izimaplasma bacterium ZiA1]